MLRKLSKSNRKLESTKRNHNKGETFNSVSFFFIFIDMENYKTHPIYKNYDISNKGNVRNNKTNKILKKRVHPRGYEQINIRDEKKCVTALIHRLVIETWQGIINEGLQVDHIDRNRLNNDITNLRVVTPIENLDNRLVIGNVPFIVFNKFTNKFIVGDNTLDDIEQAITLFKDSI